MGASYLHIENTSLQFKNDAPAPRQRAHSDVEVRCVSFTESDISDVATQEASTTASDGPSRPHTPDPSKDPAYGMCPFLDVTSQEASTTASDGPSRLDTPDPFEDPAYGMHPLLQPWETRMRNTDAAALPFRWRQAPLPDMQQAQLISERLPLEAMQQRSLELFELMAMRRSVRFFSNEDVPIDVVEACVATAGTCPSGVHKQPWFYAIVRSHDLKQRIREVVEEEEKCNYENEKRMCKDHKNKIKLCSEIFTDRRLMKGDGAPMKPYLTEAPVLIAAFKQVCGVGDPKANYWVGESCGMSLGFLQVALHNVGLATLPTRPSGAEHKIKQLLGHPNNQKLFMLLPVGYPSQDATIPYREVARKPLADICAVY